MSQELKLILMVKHRMFRLKLPRKMTALAWLVVTQLVRLFVAIG
jgi:hypothetical protein